MRPTSAFSRSGSPSAMKPDAIQMAAINGRTRLSNCRRRGRLRQVAQTCHTFAATSETAISGSASRSGMTTASTEMMTSGMPSPMAPLTSPPRNSPAIATARVNGSMENPLRKPVTAFGRSGRIRTCDPHTPSVMRYQTALRSDAANITAPPLRAQVTGASGAARAGPRVIQRRAFVTARMAEARSSRKSSRASSIGATERRIRLMARFRSVANRPSPARVRLGQRREPIPAGWHFNATSRERSVRQGEPLETGYNTRTNRRRQEKASE